MAQLVWRFEGRVAIAVHGTSDPSNLEWTGYLRDTVAQPKPSMLRVLVISHGGGPTGAQRKQLTDALRQSVPTAFLSDRFLARGLVNTLAWFNPNLRAYGLREEEAAFEFLGFTDTERKTAVRLRAELEKLLQLAVANPKEAHV
jgi:hypothetical protein